ncbi:GDSL-type esterase/lipase family protein [Gorillibacterium sp. sgz500922]|uniref:SGNH/GDSL hydrolase family protein n=1 Tax=Gorillibacterium sp. sgz500922 TaxID=3446694 RepID=UPI003F6810E1
MAKEPFSPIDTRSYPATDPYVKRIGRTCCLNGALWLALSGSGVEFTFTGKRAELVLLGESVPPSPGNQPRIGIYVNGRRVIDDMVDEPSKTYTVWESESDERVTVRVVKLSEAAMSTVGIREIRIVAPTPIQPTPVSPRKIEFIGDSITAGYGVDDETAQQPFSTATEDVTKTYATLTAQAFEADCSIVAYSGYGIISGYTEEDRKLTSQLVPDYYDKVAYSVGSFGPGVKPESLDWDFQAFAPDLIVINLGTNDDSYTKDVPERQAEYAQRYAEFLQQVRDRNPQARILCTLGIMGDRLFPFLEQAVADYAGKTSDDRIGTMKFDVQLEADGYGSDWHPSGTTQRKATEKLTAKIKAFMGW